MFLLLIFGLLFTTWCTLAYNVLLCSIYRPTFPKALRVSRNMHTMDFMEGGGVVRPSMCTQTPAETMSLSTKEAESVTAHKSRLQAISTKKCSLLT